LAFFMVCFVVFGPPAVYVLTFTNVSSELARFASVVFFHLLVTGHFFLCAKDLSAPLRYVLSHGPSEIGAQNAVIICRLLRWLDVLAVLLILIIVTFALMALYETAAFSIEVSSGLWFAIMFLFTVLRLSMSYAHLIITKPASQTIFELIDDVIRVRIRGSRVVPSTSSGQASGRVEGDHRPAASGVSSGLRDTTSRLGATSIMSGLSIVSDITVREDTSGVLGSEQNSSVDSIGPSEASSFRPMFPSTSESQGPRGAMSEMSEALSVVEDSDFSTDDMADGPSAPMGVSGLELIPNLFEVPSYMEEPPCDDDGGDDGSTDSSARSH